MLESNSTEFIFSPPPQYGLRGDPLLWKWIRVRFESNPTWSEESFQKMLLETFTLLTDQIPEKGKNYFIQQIDTGGMSGGMICSDFWIDIGFPLLMSRFRKVLNS
jgi:hypothetical protein